jgi:predicted nucleic acid-binding protein
VILVDSSVWIDYFNGKDTIQTVKLDELLGVELLGIGDLILTEVLQGFRSDADYRVAKQMLISLTVSNMLGLEVAIKSADNFRELRKQRVTIRKTIDVMIATFCIENGHSLLFSDKDFIPCVNNPGLTAVLVET